MPQNNQSTNSPPVNNSDQPIALTVDEAREAVLQLIEVTSKTETIELTKAVGRTIATTIDAKVAIPPFTNSAMDGYAIRHQDATTDRQFRIVGKSLAGHPFNGRIKEGEAVRITTGAAVPNGADAIVIQELVTRHDDTFTTTATIKAYQYFRQPGDDIKQGQRLLDANTPLNAADIGLLAAQGISQIEIFAKAKVGVFSTGDELCSPSTTLATGQIFDSNRATIQSILTNAGIESVDLGICKDDPTALTALMQSASNFDFLLSSGGVSVGEADYVKEVLESNGALNFWKVAMKPGKPLVSGKLSSGAYYFGLPGNPVSSMVTCVQFVVPAIRAFSGVKYRAPLTLQARCMDTLQKEPGRFEFQRGIASTDESGQLTVTTTGLQDSHVLSSMSKANCFICLDQLAAGANCGEKIQIIMFSSLAGL